MTRHTGTCQHVLHPKDKRFQELRDRPYGVSRATPEENSTVPPCARCAYPMQPWLWSVDPTRHVVAV